ncbi:hypothetical protein OIY81_599 [Cryptosporidium canis]|uniref:Signal peptide-containing protein n=1 Tax=Cryptosporidium canis TaxID=195482 RepID=A0ABQ8P2X5_9CRYT|nr:hypothetical protein OJ252_3238 [Cryptosporidium canis]KAJ1614224.1 hypothetical protein OIY81_599 [Cryptosporidium canis]
MARPIYLHILIILVIALASINIPTTNEKGQLIELSFLNARAPELYEPRSTSSLETSLGLILFPTKDEGESYLNYLKRFGYSEGGIDSSRVCKKSTLKKLSRELKTTLSDYYLLLGKQLYFGNLENSETQTQLESTDIANYKIQTRPILIQTERKLASLLEELFRCILSIKTKKHHRKQFDSQSSVCNPVIYIYHKSITTMSKYISALLKDEAKTLGKVFPKCLRNASGAELIECKSVGEALQSCKTSYTLHKQIMENHKKSAKKCKRYQVSRFRRGAAQSTTSLASAASLSNEGTNSPALKGILKSSQSPSGSLERQKKVRFSGDTKGDYE